MREKHRECEGEGVREKHRKEYDGANRECAWARGAREQQGEIVGV